MGNSSSSLGLVLGLLALPLSCGGESTTLSDGGAGSSEQATGGGGGTGGGQDGTGAAAGRGGTDTGSGGDAASSMGGSSPGVGGTGSGGRELGQAGFVSAGRAGGAGGTTALTPRFGFDSDAEGWVFQYASSGTLPDGSMPPVIDRNGVIVDWATSQADGGALRVGVPFAAASQYVGIGVHLNGEDMTGKTVAARVKLVSGPESADDLVTSPGGAKLYVKSGASYIYATGSYHLLDTVGAWLTLSFDLARPDYVDESQSTRFDPSAIGELGIQFDTGAMTTTAHSAVLLIDDVTF